MEIKELQQKADEIINAIDNKVNVKHNDSLTIRHLIEEIGELAEEINKPDLRNEQINKENLSDELTDVLLFTIRLANNNNINLEEAINNKINKLKKRHNL